MFQDKYVFAQLTAFLSRTQFNNYVRKYDGNCYVKHFTCWYQLLAMMFGQLSNRESLRDLIVAFEAHRAKQYHLGLGRKPIAKTTFASANLNRDYRIFEDFAFYMMEQARKKQVTDIFKLKGNDIFPIIVCDNNNFFLILYHYKLFCAESKQPLSQNVQAILTLAFGLHCLIVTP